MGGSKVLSDDGVPEGLSGSGHSHGKRKEGKLGHSGRANIHQQKAGQTAVEQGLVDESQTAVTSRSYPIFVLKGKKCLLTIAP